jgi:hypothetical protein
MTDYPPDQQAPPPGYPPQPGYPPTEKRKRHWLLPTAVGVGAFLLGLVIGVAGGSGDEPTTAAPTEPAATVTLTATVTPAAPAEPPATEAPPAEEVPAEDTLSDEGWTLTNLEVSDNGFGGFGAVGRVTNETGQAVEGAVFSLSVLDADGGVVATMDGAVSNVDDGETVTVEFISADDYQDGDWTYEFTVAF